MIMNYLPAVLQHPKGSISMERALNQIKAILEEYNAVSSAGGDDAAADRSQASIDDVDKMLEKIRR